MRFERASEADRDARRGGARPAPRGLFGVITAGWFMAAALQLAGVGGVWAQGEAWPPADGPAATPGSAPALEAPRSPDEDAPEAGEGAVAPGQAGVGARPPGAAEPTAGMPAGVPAGAPTEATLRAAAAELPAGEAAPPLFAPAIDGAARYGLVLLVWLLAYLLPTVAYPLVLAATTFGPGAAAATCIATGAVVLAFPGVLLVMAREVFIAGEIIPWYKQAPNYGPAGLAAGLLLLLALVASRAGARAAPVLPAGRER